MGALSCSTPWFCRWSSPGCLFWQDLRSSLPSQPLRLRWSASARRSARSSSAWRARLRCVGRLLSKRANLFAGWCLRDAFSLRHQIIGFLLLSVFSVPDQSECNSHSHINEFSVQASYVCVAPIVIGLWWPDDHPRLGTALGPFWTVLRIFSLNLRAIFICAGNCPSQKVCQSVRLSWTFRGAGWYSSGKWEHCVRNLQITRNATHPFVQQQLSALDFFNIGR